MSIKVELHPGIDKGKPFPWKCPHCQHDTTISNESHWASDISLLDSQGSENQEHHRVGIHFNRCPNRDCLKFTFMVVYFEHGEFQSGNRKKTGYRSTGAWCKPEASGRVWPKEVRIPDVILEDYNEANLILSKSPKASATLARRCLQGIIRDFWNISKNTLNQEISSLEEKIDDPELWRAIDTIRKVGNIGAHMEKDTDKIISVDTGEAETLLNLVELLIDEWYVSRHHRQLRISQAIDLGKEKDQKKNS